MVDIRRKKMPLHAFSNEADQEFKQQERKLRKE